MVFSIKYIHSFIHHSTAAAECGGFADGRHAGRRYRSTASGAQQQRRRSTSPRSTALSSECGQCHVDSRVDEAEHRLAVYKSGHWWWPDFNNSRVDDERVVCGDAAATAVPNAALSRTCYVLRFVLSDRADLRRAYYKSYGRVAVIGRRQTLSAVPEYRALGVDTLPFPPDDPSGQSRSKL